MRTRVLLAALPLVLVVACSGGDDSEQPSAPRDPADPGATEAAIPTWPVPVIERTVPDDGSPLVAGPGDQRYTISGAAAAGGDMLAVGAFADEDSSDSRALLLHSRDGNAWEDLSETSSLDEGATLAAAVAVGEDLLVIGNARAGSDPTIWPLSDGGLGEPTPVTFPEGRGDEIVEHAVAADDRIYALGTLLDVPDEPGQVDMDDPPTVSVVVTVSDDAGQTWTPVEMPAQLFPVPSVPAMVESLAGGHSPLELAVAPHGDDLVLAVGAPGADGNVTTMWRLTDGAWTELGNTQDLLDGRRLDLLHTHAGSLFAFTTADGDTTVSVSSDGGTSFEDLALDASVFGGGGRQSVTAAASMEGGALLVAGQNAGTSTGAQTPSELELWLTRDLEHWERALDEPQLAGSGAVRPAGVVVLGDRFVVVGTHERVPTGEETEAYNEAAGEGAVARPQLAQDAAAWTVSVEEEPVSAASVAVSAVDVDGFDGDVEIKAMAPGGDGLVAVGWIRGDDDATAAVWTSSDGANWSRVDAPAIDEPEGQYIYGLEETAGGLVAVGQTVDGDTRSLGVWTSPDGFDWTRSELTGPEFESSAAYGLAETETGLIAVGTGDSGDEDRYRSVGIWVSEDDGASWTAIDTSGEPFRQSNVEVLSDIVVAADGRIVAAGHVGDAEVSEGGGFSYTPQAYAVESTDGETWIRTEFPSDEDGWSDIAHLWAGDDGVVGVGSSGADSGGLPGDPALATSGVGYVDTDGWVTGDRLYRHTPRLADLVDSPFGVIAVGSWSRRVSGDDVLVAVLTEDSPEFITEGLLGNGDQAASVAALLGDQVVVLGTETIDDETAVVGWSVTG